VKSNHDLVDHALDLLRADAPGGGPSLNPQLENRLMQRYDARSTTPRPMFARPAVIAAALLAVTGVTFATAGGIQRIKSWFVTVEVGDQTVHLRVGDNEEASMISESDDGVRTHVTVNKGATEHGDDMTKVRVVQDRDGGKNITESVMVRGHGPAGPESEYSLEDIGDAQPAKTWTDSAGLMNEIYIVPAAKGDGAQVFYVSAIDTPEMRIHRLAEPQGQWFGEGVTHDVSVTDDGVITLRAQFPDGGEEVMKLKFRSRTRIGKDEPIDEKGVRVETPDGKVKIKIEESVEGEETDPD